MAGMFYTLAEAAEKLNKTEEELKQIVEDGKLREFRDGPNLLFKVEEVEALMSDTGIPASEEAAVLEIPEPETPAPEIPTPETPAPLEQVEQVEEVADAELDEILLAPETGAPVPPSELTDADTALTGEGINVLGETDRDYEITDDTMGETAIPMGSTGTTPEVPLEEIEDDVNLDSFGSGSGLLDLSLQADDTSLGGILDEIYTAEDEGKEPVEAGSGSAAAVAAEAEEMIPEEEFAVPTPVSEVPALAQAYIQMAPDTQSNVLGMLLFLPLVVVIYTAVVAVAGLREVPVSILATIQGFIWYIMGGAAVVSALVVVAAFLVTGGEGGTATKKAKKEKKPKKKKAKKPKKNKKGKKALPDSEEDTIA